MCGRGEWGEGGGRVAGEGDSWRLEITRGGARRRDVDILGWGKGWGGGGRRGVGGGFVRVDLLSGVVPRDRKSGGYVSLDMGHRQDSY